ncbi:uncharacterized protein [Primulina eburnea]|uniref:uncharacterized protein isoform X8 n=1 Tax=Primulina eburnea TaxID=1245227 RepID=UPI003C6BF917
MQETTCLQCGYRGSTNAFVYCVKCLDVAVHRYCLDVIPGYNEFIHWVCDECRDEAQNRKSTVDSHTFAEPAIKPIWMGSFHILNKKPSMLDGVIAHVSTRACPEVHAESSQFQPVLHLEMLPKSDVWPKSFEISELSWDNIALYFFPSEISEWNFDIFVDEMMHKELAMRAFVQNAELLVFTSRDLPSLYWRFQYRYYLWGVFRGKHRPPANSHLCREELGRHVMMHGVSGCKITETMKSCDARSLLDTLRKVETTGKSRMRGRPLDDAWDHALPMDDIRQGTKCKYCNFFSKRGGITRLKAHLGGGDPTMRIKGCPNVSTDIKNLMEKEMKTFNERPKRPFQAATTKSSGRGRPLDDAWEHCIPLDNIRQGAKCKYCNFVSKRGGIARLKAHLGGGDPIMRIRGCLNVSVERKEIDGRRDQEMYENAQ